MKIKILSLNNDKKFNELTKNFFLIKYELYVDLYFFSDFDLAFESYQNNLQHIIFINIDFSPNEGFRFLNYVEFFNPFIVFVSKDDSFALKSYDYRSTYYLVSNYDSQQLNVSFQKIFLRFQSNMVNLNLNDNLNSNYGDYLTVTSTRRIDVLRINDIVYLEADGRYTHIYTNNGLSKIAVKNLGEVEKKLDPKKFCRVHHKYIINVIYLESIYKSDGLYCEMITKVNVPISKRKYEDLNRFLNIGNTIKLIE